MAKTKDFQLRLLFLDKTKKGLGSLSKNIKGVASSVFSLKTAFVGLAGASAMGFVIKRSLDATDALGKTADKIGVTTEELASMRYAAKLTGVETNTMDMALQRFTRRAAEAALGTGEAKNALKELGIDARKIADMPLTDQMMALSDAFADFSEADQVRLAMRLFDSEGVALVNTLALGSDGLREMISEAELLGLTLSREAVLGAEKANDAFTKLGSLFKGVTDNIVVGLAPAITALTTYLTDKFITSIQDSDGSVAKFGNTMATNLVYSAQVATVAIANMINKVTKGISAAVAKFDDFRIGSLNNEVEDLNTEFNTLNGIVAKMQMPELGELSGSESWYLFTERMVGDTDAIKARFTEVSNLLLSKGVELDGLFANRTLVGADLIDVAGIDEAFSVLQERLAVAAIEMDENFVGPIQEKFTNAFTNIKQTVTDAGLMMAQTTNNAMMSVMGSVQNILGGLMSATEQGSSGYKALFAISKGIAVAQAIVGANLAGTSTLAAYAAAAPMVALGGPAALIAWQAKGAAMASLVTGLGYANAAVIGATAAQSFDGGGFTGAGSRSGGLDGKGGFPAILHPNETVIDHTKGQGTGGVVINQTINVTTGVQQTVRAEIKNLMPKIAEETKMAVADAKRRGGHYGRAFV